MALISLEPKDNKFIPNKDVSELLFDVSKKKMCERIQMVDENGRPYHTTVGEALMTRLADIGLYSQNEKNAIVAAKFCIESAFGKAGTKQEVEKEEMPEIVFKLTPTQNKELLRKSALPVPASDEEEDDSGKIIVEVEGEDGVLKYD